MPAPLSLLRLSTVLVLSLAAAVAAAQTDKADKADKADKPLTDAERAKRDADRVFSFIKFQTVRPAAAPAPATPAPPAARSAAAPRPADTPAAAAPAPEPTPAPVTRGLTLSASPAATQEPTLTTAELPASAVVQTSSAVLTPAKLPAASEIEVPLRLVAYVAPDMNAQVLAAMTSSQVNVPVRFTVQPDGRVSAAQAVGNAPRRIAQAATRAVQQWRFEPISAVREVEVEIAFKAE